MSACDGLFWYPAINGVSFGDQYSKADRLNSYIRYMLARLQCMFKYTGLPDTIPAKWFEHYLLVNGQCVIARAEDGNLYAFFGGYGGDPDAYYIPTKYIVANPYLKFDKTFTIGEDCCMVYGDTYAQGVIPLLNRYCSQLVENDISMELATILCRATINISAADDKTKASAELYLKRLKDGELGVIMEQAFIEGLNIREFKAAAESLIPLIEEKQYIKASLFNELGLNSNYNMKRESINSNESQLNDDMLHPLIDNMLKERQEGIKRVNEMFNLNISVSFDSAWLENEIEEQAAVDMMTADESIDTSVVNDMSEEPGTDQIEVPAEEPVEEQTEEQAEEPAEPVEELTEAVEELTVAVESVVDVIEGVNGDELS